MNIVILGPQGSGKGTQAKLLVEKFGFFYFESGEFLRQIAENNEVLRNMMDEGKLVPSEELVAYIEAYLDEKQVYDNILFDGFPRQLEQYKFVKGWLSDKKVKIDLVLVLNISEETTLNRLSLRKREDDTEESIKERLKLYNDQTVPLIDELRKDTKVVEVDGERTVDAIQKDLERIIENAKN
ncbi:MAG TPA: nucleoside monophosphate kinase [Patescibacteria group bacterium]|nr:nucleoside monophosphate kinase [Patescibacteria group bacterium]